MTPEEQVVQKLEQLKQYCPSGYALAMHIHFTTAQLQFVSYEKNWLEYYSSHGLVMKDPVVLWGMMNTGFVRWDDLTDEDEGNVIGAARDHGIENGVTCAFERGGTRTITGFSRPSGPFSEAEIAEMQKIAEDLHDITADIKSLSSEAHAKLRKMAIMVTHQ